MKRQNNLFADLVPGINEILMIVFRIQISNMVGRGEGGGRSHHDPPVGKGKGGGGIYDWYQSDFFFSLSSWNRLQSILGQSAFLSFQLWRPFMSKTVFQENKLIYINWVLLMDNALIVSCPGSTIFPLINSINVSSLLLFLGLQFSTI